ncbi:MAG: magnesium and cobalt transport protein CorA [Aeromicrobium sp.]|uniref:magnesium and cobalt transport protein CorA n=1 Tax=Aeromicrobium sp. TaxID=1871063 RepID=UPI0039E61D39
MIVDGAVYRDGLRTDLDHDLDALAETVAGLEGNDFLWVALDQPTPEEVEEAGRVLRAWPPHVARALRGQHRPRVETYGAHTLVSLRLVEYSDDDVTTHDVDVVLGERRLILIQRGGETLADALDRLEPRALRFGAAAGLYALVATALSRSEQVAEELEVDVEEVEASVFSPDRSNDSMRIYRLKREALEFRRAVAPLHAPITRLADEVAGELAPFLRDVAQRISRLAETASTIDRLLDNALTAHLAQLSVQQNEDMRKLTAGATLFAIPTAIAGIYGMNFRHMPELDWTFGYPLCLLFMAALCGYVYYRFKRSGWL